MKNYIGLDAHSKTCTFISMDKDGNTLAQGTFKTSERNLISMLKSLESPKSLVAEESNLAQWIYVVTKDHVDELIVCNPVYLPRKSGPKNDFRDAVHLANQLRTNNLSPVYHEESFLMGLRTMVSQYEDIVIQNVRLVNQYKSLLRSENIATETTHLTLLNEKKSQEIKNATTRFVAEGVYHQLVELQAQRDRYVAQFKLNLKSDKTLKNLATIPGIGEVRANVIAAFICCGSRFVNKHKLWAYAMLVRHAHESDGHVLRRRTPYGRTELKNAYMGAAQRIATSSKETGLKKFYDELLNKPGYDERMAKKALARKTAAISLMIMKTGAKYEDRKVRNELTN